MYSLAPVLLGWRPPARGQQSLPRAPNGLHPYKVRKRINYRLGIVKVSPFYLSNQLLETFLLIRLVLLNSIRYAGFSAQI